MIPPSQFLSSYRAMIRPLMACAVVSGGSFFINKEIRTECETQPSPRDDQPTEPPKWNNNSFPNLTRHGKDSLLRQFLTKEVYDMLKTDSTSAGVTLDDIIKAGVCLPSYKGRLGVFCGDAESYRTFSLLLNPILESYHTTTLKKRPSLLLQRFKTNLDPQHVVQRRLDPEGDYILLTRMRLARSITGFRFGPCIHRGERRAIEELIRDCVSNWGGTYKSVMDMDNSLHEKLVKRQILFPNPDETLLSAGLGRDWPDARGIYCDSITLQADVTPHVVLWINAPQDHVWIISNEKGGNVQAVFSRLSRTVWRLESELQERGHSFAEDRQLGFLNSSPADIGTALRASVVIKLVRLGRQRGFADLINRLRLEAKAQNDISGYTGIFDVGNAEALGKTEVQNINTMIQGVAKLIELERRLEQGETLDLDKLEGL